MTEMTYRPLGDSGLVVSAVGVGCNAFGRRVGIDGVRDVLAGARDAGVTLLDTADAYGDPAGRSEELLGEALEGSATSSWWRRSSGWACAGCTARTTACAGRGSTSSARSRGRCAGSGPTTSTCTSCTSPTSVTPIEETLSALSDLVREGKVRYLGCSNFAAWQVADADWTARSAGLERFVSVQNRYSLLDRTVEDEVVPACETLRARDPAVLPAGVRPAHRQVPPRRAGSGRAPGPTSTRPARSGWNAPTGTGSRPSRSTPRRATSAYSTSPSPAWPPSPRVASVIAGAVSGDQVRTNAAALRWDPTEADLVELDEITS